VQNSTALHVPKRPSDTKQDRLPPVFHPPPTATTHHRGHHHSHDFHPLGIRLLVSPSLLSLFSCHSHSRSRRNNRSSLEFDDQQTLNLPTSIYPARPPLSLTFPTSIHSPSSTKPTTQQPPRHPSSRLPLRPFRSRLDNALGHRLDGTIKLICSFSLLCRRLYVGTQSVDRASGSGQSD
jgi:hypothetical protein